MEGYFYLGKVLKPFAAKGALLVNLDVDTPEDYEDMESVFVQMNGQLIPFLIERVELKHNNRAAITFADIDSIEQASIIMRLKAMKCMMLIMVSLAPSLKCLSIRTRLY